MLCHAMLCCAMLCCAVLCCAVLYHAMLCHAMLCFQAIATLDLDAGSGNGDHAFNIISLVATVALAKAVVFGLGTRSEIRSRNSPGATRVAC